MNIPWLKNALAVVGAAAFVLLMVICLEVFFEHDHGEVVWSAVGTFTGGCMAIASRFIELRKKSDDG